MSVGDSIDRSVDSRPRACIRLSGALGVFFPGSAPVTERKEGGGTGGGGGGAHTFTGVGLRAGIVLRWLDVRSSGVGGKNKKRAGPCLHLQRRLTWCVICDFYAHIQMANRTSVAIHIIHLSGQPTGGRKC